MDFLEVLKVFRPFYGKNQKYYSEIHPILYYNDEIYTNPFLNYQQEVKEETQEKLTKFDNVDKHIDNYKLGYNRNNFLKLLLRILKEQNFNLSQKEIINQMIYDFDSLNLYKEYNFKQYKISRIDLRNLILKEDFDNTYFIQFCVDYFSFIIHIFNNETIESYYPRNDKNIRAPKIFLYQDLLNQRFYHIRVTDKLWLESNDKNYNKYLNSKPKLIRQDCEIQEQEEEKKEEPVVEEKVFYDCTKLIKMKLSELQGIAEELNIEIQKLNPRKTRMINKKKDELIADIVRKN